MRTPGHKLRVAHILYRLDVGGMENGLVNLVNLLPEDEFEHVIITLAGWSDFSARITRPGVQLESVHKRPGKDLDVYRRMFRLLRKIRPDIVHTRNWGTIDMQWVARSAGVPRRVHSEHGWDMGDLTGASGRRRRLRRLCRPAIQHFVVVSRDIADWMRVTVGVSPTQISQIANGVDTHRFMASGAGVPDLPWGGDDLFIVGTVGRCEPTKDQVTLLEALARLRQERVEGCDRLRLAVVGDGPSLAMLRARARELGIDALVWFPGSRSDIPDVLRSIDLFVLPSLNEGMSNTILEAMASGLPVVATNVGGNPELVEPGATGALFASRDVGQLARAIETYMNRPDLRRTHGATARQLVETRYSLARMATQYGAVYRATDR